MENNYTVTNIFNGTTIIGDGSTIVRDDQKKSDDLTHPQEKTSPKSIRNKFKKHTEFVCLIVATLGAVIFGGVQTYYASQSETIKSVTYNKSNVNSNNVIVNVYDPVALKEDAQKVSFPNTEKVITEPVKEPRPTSPTSDNKFQEVKDEIVANAYDKD